ncbi:unnamed protein product [Gongylonema pulchrum]|uniref:Protein muscleblind n=1 Tax=Gongylonema pulchrum TaxID=637853 RepID=A0A183DIS5_9BILA|nr:unnamed protein product [Gongylonema pulchrum]
MADYQMMKRRVPAGLEQLGLPPQRLLNMSAAQASILNGAAQGCTGAPPGPTALYTDQQIRLLSAQSSVAAATSQQLLMAHHQQQQQQQEQQQHQHPGAAPVPMTSMTSSVAAASSAATETTVVASTAPLTTATIHNSLPQPHVQQSQHLSPLSLHSSQTGVRPVPGAAAPHFMPAPPMLQQHQQQPPLVPPHPYLLTAAGTGAGHPYIPHYIEETIAAPQSDPFTPPSYAPEMKNVVVLQPL